MRKYNCNNIIIIIGMLQLRSYWRSDKELPARQQQQTLM